MKCLVCFASWDERTSDTCPRCGYDMVGGGATDPAGIARARAAYRQHVSADARAPGPSRGAVMWRWVGLLVAGGLLAWFFR